MPLSVKYLHVLLLLPLLLSLLSPVSSSRPNHAGKKWCKVPEEYCTSHDDSSDRACYMPLGMRCERGGKLVDETQTITETVTVTIAGEAVETGVESMGGLGKEGQGGAVKMPADDRNKTKRSLDQEIVKELLHDIKGLLRPEDDKQEHLDAEKQVPDELKPRAAAPAYTSRFDFTAKTPVSRIHDYMEEYAAQASAVPSAEFERLPEPDMPFKRDTDGEASGDETADMTLPSSSPQNLAAMPPPKTIWAEKPVLEVSCVVRPRILWDDFKITWGPAWKDATGCKRLFHAMDKRGLVTGYKCGQFADIITNSFYMEARGHRPRFPKSLVADAIREAFANENTLYYRGYENSLLCERNKDGWFSKR